jgi:DNA-binding CsgD family transcriptional regulator
LGTSPTTVKWHVKNLYRKLRVSSRGHALVRALRLGVLAPEDLTASPNG